METLSKQQTGFCENAGLFGLLMSTACLFQHFYFMIPHWISFTISGIYLLCITAFILLMKKKAKAPALLFIAVILILFLQVFMLLTLTFSLVLFLLLIYLVIIVAITYAGGIKKQLLLKQLAEKEEAAKWEQII